MRSRFWDFSQKGVHILGFWVLRTLSRNDCRGARGARAAGALWSGRPPGAAQSAAPFGPLFASFVVTDVAIMRSYARILPQRLRGAPAARNIHTSPRALAPKPHFKDAIGVRVCDGYAVVALDRIANLRLSSVLTFTCPSLPRDGGCCDRAAGCRRVGGHAARKLNFNVAILCTDLTHHTPT